MNLGVRGRPGWPRLWPEGFSPGWFSHRARPSELADDGTHERPARSVRVKGVFGDSLETDARNPLTSVVGLAGIEPRPPEVLSASSGGVELHGPLPWAGSPSAGPFRGKTLRTWLLLRFHVLLDR